MNIKMATWECSFLYKVKIFMQNSHLHSEVEDLVHNRSVIHPIVGVSVNSLQRFMSYSSQNLQRFFLVNPFSLQVAYTSGLSGGGCGYSRAREPILKVSNTPKLDTPKAATTDRPNPIATSVQYVSLRNDGAFEVSLYLEDHNEYQTESTEFIPAWGDDVKTINLADTSFAAGCEVTVVANVLLGVTKKSDQKLIFELNGKTAQFVTTGSSLHPKLKLKSTKEREGSFEVPADWPEGILVHKSPFHNWASNLITPEMWTCAPRNYLEAVKACNWAAKNSYRLRPRGVMHGWSPLSVDLNESANIRILFLDTTKYLRDASFKDDGVLGPRVVVGAGYTMGELMEFLEKAPGGGTYAPGWSFTHIPAPCHLTIGGVLAINAHGTAIPCATEQWEASYGSISNHVLEVKVLASDPANPEEYSMITFKRGEQETKAFLANLGRTLILEATLKVIPNYNLRCLSNMKIKWDVLCAAPKEDGSDPENSVGKFLEQSGRVEVIWFPFSECPWIKVWTKTDKKPESSRRVDRPNNYSFSDQLPHYITEIVKEITNDSKRTRYFCKMMEAISRAGIKQEESRDIWGPSKNTLQYVRDQTLRVTANGYAVMMNRKDVQKAVHLFANKYNDMVLAYEEHDKFPINSPLEIRITGLDDSKYVPTDGYSDAGRPFLSALASDAVSKRNNWDVALWLDVLTIPGTKHSNEFYAEMELWFLDTFKGQFARVRPEWSKGWAYTNEGPWNNERFLAHTRNSFDEGHDADDNWNWQIETLQKYDRKNIFTSPFNQQLFNRI